MSLLKNFIPPILIKHLNRTREYKSYDEAYKKASKDAYENKMLCEIVAKKTNSHIKQLNTKPLQLNAINVFLLSAIQNYFCQTSKKEIHIVDFGGACGVHYFEINRFFSKDYIIKWTVIETTEMVEAAKKNIVGYDGLSFKNKIEDMTDSVDILYSSCALLYTHKPYEFLDKLINVKANWILFNRMMFNAKDRDIYTLQKSTLSSNGPGLLPEGYADAEIKYPHTTLSLPKFKNRLTANYNMEWVFEEKTGVHQINTEDIIGMGMLFKKRTLNDF